MPPPDSAPEECAQCGADIPRRARACPACGADERTGWRESSPYDGLDLPDSAWAEEEAQRPAGAPRVNGLAWYWWIAGALLLASLVLAVLGLR